MNKVLELLRRFVDQIAIGPRLFKGRNGVTYFPTPRGFFTSPEDRWRNLYKTPPVFFWEEEFAYQNNDPTPREITEWERRAKKLWDQGRSHLPGTLVEKNLLTGEYRYLGFGYAVTFQAQFVGHIANAAEQRQIFDRAGVVATEFIDGRRQGSRLWFTKEPLLEGTLEVALVETNML